MPDPRIVQIPMPAARSERLLTPLVWQFPGVEIDFGDSSSEEEAEEELEQCHRPQTQAQAQLILEPEAEDNEEEQIR